MGMLRLWYDFAERQPRIDCMSSAAHLTLDADADGSTDSAWDAFVGRHSIEYSPQTVGGATYYWLGPHAVEVTRRSPTQITFSTFFMGEHRRDVATLALAAWMELGGSLDACDEVKSFFSVGRD